MWNTVGLNLLSDVIFSVGIFLLSFGSYLLTQRIRLLKFFCVDKSKKLTIFTSNLVVEKYGSTGNDGIPYSFQGTAIPYEESKAASQIHNLFNYFLPSQFEKPGLVSKILISDIDAKILPAPKSANIIEKSSTVVSLGFPPYNIISKLIEETYHAPAKLHYVEKNVSSYKLVQSDNTAGTATPIQVTFDAQVQSSTSNRVISATGYEDSTSASAIQNPEITHQPQLTPSIEIPNFAPFLDTYVGFIQKIFDNQNKRFFFYIAGLSEYSTAGSAYYLVDNWKTLQKMYGNDSSFCILVKVSSTNIKSSQLIYKS